MAPSGNGVDFAIEPGLLCSQTTLTIHHLSVGHGLVDPNRQEFESFEDQGVEKFMWTVVGVSVSLVFQLFSVFLSPASRLLDPKCCMDGALAGSRHESIKESTISYW